ncbi:CapA family protein [Arthrobacter sp. SO3]|uniref:CapA family protein n=1 Tax=Arthrobacter sp. SO3 TaxID=1897057 RepID=UPI001CFFD233|nr:CapA family protein [Arthrobacter sp. SO3]MCB5291369.1 putative polyglutamine synthesis accessory protein [Arthrobacter sp. SO3]
MLIALLGDVMLGRLVNERLRRVGADYPWGDTDSVLRQADLTVANLECVLAAGGEPEAGKVFHFRSDPKNVESLRSAGIGVVSLANNHVLDYGASAFREMLPVLDSAGILHAGAGLDRDAAQRPAVRRVAGTAVGLIAITDNQPDWEADRGPGVFYVPVERTDRRVTELLALVGRTKARVGLLIVSAHWGPNWGSGVPSDHRELARALIEAGADVVFGHSPHIFRGVEIFQDRPIIYSAGDFVDDYAVDPLERNDQSFIFLLDTDGGTPRTLRLYPTVITDFQARLAGGSSRQIAERMQRLSRHLGTAGSWDAAGGFLEIPLAAG